MSKKDGHDLPRELPHSAELALLCIDLREVEAGEGRVIRQGLFQEALTNLIEHHRGLLEVPEVPVKTALEPQPAKRVEAIGLQPIGRLECAEEGEGFAAELEPGQEEASLMQAREVERSVPSWADRVECNRDALVNLSPTSIISVQWRQFDPCNLLSFVAARRRGRWAVENAEQFPRCAGVPGGGWWPRRLSAAE